MNSKNLEIFERYNDRLMNESEKEAFEQRLKEDQSFREDYDEYNAIYEAISDREVMELRGKLKNIGRARKEGGSRAPLWGLDNRWFWLAAVLILSLSLVSVTYLYLKTKVSEGIQVVGKAERPSDSMLYSLEPAYEELIRYRVRSEDFHLEQPRDSAVVDMDSTLRFSWHAHTTEPIYFDIMNNRGTLVYTSQGPLLSPFSLDRKLSKGVYSFRFRTRSVTLYTGLFFIV